MIHKTEVQVLLLKPNLMGLECLSILDLELLLRVQKACQYFVKINVTLFISLIK